MPPDPEMECRSLLERLLLVEMDHGAKIAAAVREFAAEIERILKNDE